MRVAIVRGQHLNKWEMQGYEYMGMGISIVAFASNYGLHRIGDLGFSVRRLASLDVLGSFSLAGTIIMQPVLMGLGVNNRLFGLQRAIRDFDIVHVADTHYAFSWQVAQAKRNGRFKLIATCWETIPFEHEHFPYVAQRKRVVRSQVDCFVAMSERAASALRTEGVAAERIRVVLPGIDLQRFRSIPQRGASRLGLWQRNDAVRVLYIGRLDFAKGIREYLLAAATVMQQAGDSPAIEFGIVGDGPRPIIDPLLDSLQLRSSVSVLAGIPYRQVPELYGSADIVVLPSLPTPHWEEQFGMVLAEAMACGKAVIASNSGAIPEVVGDAGVLVPPYDAPALAVAILRLAGDQDMRRWLGARAAERARMLFDARRFGKEIKAVYEEVLGR